MFEEQEEQRSQHPTHGVLWYSIVGAASVNRGFRRLLLFASAVPLVICYLVSQGFDVPAPIATIGLLGLIPALLGLVIWVVASIFAVLARLFARGVRQVVRD